MQERKLRSTKVQRNNVTKFASFRLTRSASSDGHVFFCFVFFYTGLSLSYINHSIIEEVELVHVTKKDVVFAYICGRILDRFDATKQGEREGKVGGLACQKRSIDEERGCVCVI